MSGPSREPHTPAPRLTFTKAQHLRTPAEFDRVYALKQRASDDRLLIFAARSESGITRIGLSVSRKHGNSVRRHRLKRLLREAFRLSQHELPPGLDLIFIPRAGAPPDVPGLQQSLRRLIPRLAKRLPTLSQQPTDDAATSDASPHRQNSSPQGEP